MKLSSFPFCEAFPGFVAGQPFPCKGTADDREEKTSVRREGADGMPKFPRHAEICGRLPSSPPDESAAGTWRSLPSAVPLHGKSVDRHEARTPAAKRNAIKDSLWLCHYGSLPMKWRSHKHPFHSRQCGKSLVAPGRNHGFASLSADTVLP